MQVTAFLKSKSHGYKSKKAEVFTEDGIKNFFDEAEDLAWLDVKVGSISVLSVDFDKSIFTTLHFYNIQLNQIQVACIFGICGACRIDEFPRFTLDNIERHGDLFLVKVLQTKTKISRSFTISGTFATYVQKYMDLRSPRLRSDQRFFTNFQRGKCTVQFIGYNKFSMMSRRIATYLQLAEPERYTGTDETSLF